VKRIAILILLALLALGALAGCFSLTWQNFRAPDDRFQILMPGIPELQIQTIQTPLGEQEQHLYKVDKGPQAYMIGYTDLDDKTLAAHSADDLLDDASARGVLAVNGKLQSFEQTTYRGYPARNVVIDVADGDGVIHARYVLVGNRLYQIAAIVATKIIDEDEVERYLDSFVPLP